MNKNKEVLLSFFIQLFYVLNIVAILYVQNTTLAAIQTAIVLVCFFFFPKKIEKNFFCFIVGMILSAAISTLVINNKGINVMLMTLLYGGLAYVLLNTKLSINLFKYAFIIIALFLVLNMLTGSIMNNSLLIEKRNSISAVLMIQLFLLYISYVQHNANWPIWPAIISTVIVFWTTNRSGTIVFVFILFWMLALKIKGKISFKRIFYISFLVLIIILIFKLFYSIAFEPMITRFLNRGIDSEIREIVLQSYVNSVKNNFKYMFFGVDIYHSGIFYILNYNLHNSFLRLHSNYGLIGVCLYLGFAIYALFSYIRNRQYIYIIIITSIFIRLFTDTMAFYGPFDPLIIFLICQDTGREKTFYD